VIGLPLTTISSPRRRASAMQGCAFGLTEDRRRSRVPVAENPFGECRFGDLRLTKNGGGAMARITGTQGNDRLWGSQGDDVIYGLGGDDRIIADLLPFDNRGGDDEVYAGPGNDQVFAFAGDNRIFGGDGNDTLTTADDDDFIDAGAGADDVQSGRGHDQVLGGVGNDALRGGENEDRVDGGPDDDRVIGGSGSDTLFGGTGADTLEGRDDKDLLTGGPDADRFRFGSAAESPVGGSRDVILDFTDIDRIDLSAIDPSSLSGDQALVWLGQSAGAAPVASGAVRALDQGSIVIMQANTDADAAIDMAIELHFAGTLVQDHFLL
jgi:Ca2+-binding RTX toxin-like protein